MLDFRVETFLCVCKHMSYTKAASELAITQPAVSGHIKYIEDYYNIKLFDYENRKLTLTEDGELLRNSLETIGLDIIHIKESLQRSNKKIPLTIGATKSIGEYLLAKKLPHFIDNHPELLVSIVVDDTSHLFRMLNDGEIQFFLCEGIIDKTNYSHSFLSNEAMRAVCAPNYPLPKIKSIESLFNSRLIIREPGSGSRSILEQALKYNGYNINSFSEITTINSPGLILELVKNGCGITFIYDSVCQDDLTNKTLKEIKIPNFHVSHEYNAVWKKDSLFGKQIEAYVSELNSH